MPSWADYVDFVPDGFEYICSQRLDTPFEFFKSKKSKRSVISGEMLTVFSLVLFIDIIGNTTVLDICFRNAIKAKL